MIHFYIEKVKFDIELFERNSDLFSHGISTKINVKTPIENFDLVEKLLNNSHLINRIELEPNGLLEQCYMRGYHIKDDFIYFEVTCNKFDINYINLKKKRKQKLNKISS